MTETCLLQRFTPPQHNNLNAFISFVGGRTLQSQKHCPLTLVVQLLQTREAAQYSEAILAGVTSTTGVLSQPEHSETCQRTQMRELRE